MGTIKDRNGMDLKEAEDIKKRWQEYTEDSFFWVCVTGVYVNFSAVASMISGSKASYFLSEAVLIQP